MRQRLLKQRASLRVDSLCVPISKSFENAGPNYLAVSWYYVELFLAHLMRDDSVLTLSLDSAGGIWSRVANYIPGNPSPSRLRLGRFHSHHNQRPDGRGMATNLSRLAAKPNVT